jgi:hypothetical protein
MNQGIKLLAALLALIIPAISCSQEVHASSNGDLPATNNITISGESINGTNSSDYFIVESGVDLTIDALAGIDFIEANITGGGSTTLSYRSENDTFTVSGDSLSITGSFTSFEDINLSFDNLDSDITMSGNSWRALHIDGGAGIDKLTTPATGVAKGRIFVSEIEEGIFKISASNGHLSDFTISNFEVLSTTTGESNLYIASDSIVKFSEVSGGVSSTLDTLYLSRGADVVFVWDEGEDWYLGVLGSSSVTKITNFEWLDISAGIVYTENKELFSTQFSGRTLYGIDTIQFYANTSDIRAIDGLSREVFQGDDIDSDGVVTTLDAFPLDATESVDSDGDGIGNNADTDDDGDGVADSSDAFPLDGSESFDTDGDGIGNNADTDDDGDGVPDSDDAFPSDATESFDTDGDGIGNNADIDDDGDGYTDQYEIEMGSDPLDSGDTPRSGGLPLVIFTEVLFKTSR